MSLLQPRCKVALHLHSHTPPSVFYGQLSTRMAHSTRHVNLSIKLISRTEVSCVKSVTDLQEAYLETQLSRILITG